MQEKLSWMKRGAERIKASIDRPEEVQDHFLAFVHASHLLFFYYSRWAKLMGYPKGDVKNRVTQYVGKMERTESDAWNCLQDLRTEDVHVRLLQLFNTEQPGILMLDEQEILFDGMQLLFGNWRYSVSYGGASYDVDNICTVDVVIKERFYSEFESI